MPKSLHILNGDHTLTQFLKANIEGGTAVWREVLSDGQTENYRAFIEVASPFWFW